MVISWHDAAFTLPDPVLTPDLMFKVVKKFQLQHQLKDTWTTEETKLMQKMIFQDEDSLQGSIEVESTPEVSEYRKQQQEEIMQEINKERLNARDFRDKPDAKKTAKNVNKNRQK